MGDRAKRGSPASEAATTSPAAGGPPRTPVGPLARGHRIGNYLVLGELAAGGFGAVYKVENVVLGRRAALKVLHDDLVTSGEVLARFVREARAANRIRHPNLVDIYDFGETDDGRPYFVMELLEGMDLDAHLQERGRLPVGEVLEVLEPLCDVLSAAHASGIIHRDIKASNVFLASQGGVRRVVLLDFGVAKLIEPGRPDLTTSRTVLGTPACMAPEQIAAGPVDARTDVYALGALLYHMLTGQLPFAAHSVSEMKHLHLTAPRPRVSALTSVSPALDEVIARAMHARPDQRYAGAGELLAAFKQAIGQPAAAPAVECAAVALHLDARVAAGHLEDPGDALIDDLERVAALAQERLASRGFLLTRQLGHTLLFVRLLDASPDLSRRLRGASLDAARDLEAALAARTGRDPRVHIHLSLHAGSVTVLGDRVAGGPLLEVSRWVSDQEGLHASPDLMADLD